MAFPMKSTIMLLPKRKDHRPSSYPIYDWMPKLSLTIVEKFKLICLEPSHDIIVLCLGKYVRTQYNDVKVNRTPEGYVYFKLEAVKVV